MAFMFGFYVCAGDSHSNSHNCTASTLSPKHYKTKLNQICHFPTGPFGGLQNRRGEQTCVYVLSATGLGDLWLSQLLKQTLSPFLKSKWYLTARLPWRASKLMDRPSYIFHPLFLILSKQANVLYGFHSGWGSWWKHSHYRLENRCVKLRLFKAKEDVGPISWLASLATTCVLCCLAGWGSKDRALDSLWEQWVDWKHLDWGFPTTFSIWAGFQAVRLHWNACLLIDGCFYSKLVFVLPRTSNGRAPPSCQRGFFLRTFWTELMKGRLWKWAVPSFFL